MLVGVSGGHLTSLRFCCAANVVTASEARELDADRDPPGGAGLRRLLVSVPAPFYEAQEELPGNPIWLGRPPAPICVDWTGLEQRASGNARTDRSQVGSAPGAPG